MLLVRTVCNNKIKCVPTLTFLVIGVLSPVNHKELYQDRRKRKKERQRERERATERERDREREKGGTLALY